MDQKFVSLIKKIGLAVLIVIALIVLYFIISIPLTSKYLGTQTLNQGAVPGTSYGMDVGLGAPSMMEDYKAAAPPSVYSYNATRDAISASDTISPKVIKTGSLGLVVDKVDQAVNEITTQTTTNGGFVQNSSVNENKQGVKYGYLTLRVPANNFETLIAKIKSLAKLVEREDINGREVTEEYVDLQASLTHNLAVEAQYLELLKRAQKVEEIIAVREKLDQVQGEIESLKGRLRYLDNQTEMSTITVNLSEEPQISLPQEKWQPWVVTKQAIKDLIIMLQNFVNRVIVFIFVILGLIPYLILILIVYLIIRKIYRWYKNKKAKTIQ